MAVILQHLNDDKVGRTSFIIDESQFGGEVVNQVQGHDLNAKIAMLAQKTVNNDSYGRAILIIIVLNSAWMGIDVDWNAGEHGGFVPIVVFSVVESFFCIVFLAEIMVRFLSYEFKSLFFTDSVCWKSNLFDTFLVGMMVLEIWVLEADFHGWKFMLLRLFKLMRLLRIGRIFRMVPELGIVVKCLRRALRSLSSTLLLEIGIMYMVGLVFTQWAVEHEDPCLVEIGNGGCFLHEYFGSIAKSFLTLLQILVFDSTFSILRPVLEDTWYMGVLLIFFILLGSFTVLNMLIGINCEVICTATEEEKLHILSGRVQDVFNVLDIDSSGSVTMSEFRHGGGHKLLQEIGISKDIVENAFHFIDADTSGEFEVDEFLHAVLKLLQPPQAQDIQLLNYKVNEIHAWMSYKQMVKRGSALKSSATDDSPQRPFRQWVSQANRKNDLGSNSEEGNFDEAGDVVKPELDDNCRSGNEGLHHLQSAVDELDETGESKARTTLSSARTKTGAEDSNTSASPALSDRLNHIKDMLATLTPLSSRMDHLESMLTGVCVALNVKVTKPAGMMCESPQEWRSSELPGKATL
eukprot:gnl/MRDRNA2_/MRDRNA2_79448_c0_seq1.p1 gnl/MRDRNA2_/MRDRNA2_79448_c0~~gnl/MRDRNA2_/MRDRNA2_79448_c0_seq1.p1  ORF type:complete len:577 (+),score=100.44 gnl/MRDRNA2_/MRDRNA2_79448_c0_seq1:99-1829(+)